MKDCLLLYTRPHSGREEEYNEWYEQHVREVLEFEGMVAGQRFRIDGEGDHPTWEYLTIYEVDNLKIARPAILRAQAEREAAGNPPNRKMYVTDALAARESHWYHSVSPRVVS